MLRLHPGTVDYVIIAIYFAVVLGIGFVARLSIKTDLDFFLSGRSLPAWITGLAFIAANLGALEILGQSANGAQYGVPAVHYYWIGAVPAMVFLGLVMMPFYYGAKVRSVPGVPAAALRRARARVQRRHVRGRHRADQRRQPVRAGPDHPPAARLAGRRLDPGRRGDRARLHHARRADLGDLQRGAPVLHHLRRADTADAGGAALGGRLVRARAPDQGASPRSGTPACTPGRAWASTIRPTR